MKNILIKSIIIVLALQAVVPFCMGQNNNINKIKDKSESCDKIARNEKYLQQTAEKMEKDAIDIVISVINLLVSNKVKIRIVSNYDIYVCYPFNEKIKPRYSTSYLKGKLRKAYGPNWMFYPLDSTPQAFYYFKPATDPVRIDFDRPPYANKFVMNFDGTQIITIDSIYSTAVIDRKEEIKENILNKLAQ